ncbi:MAG: hypothetical protein WC269_00510 [Candidatus Gracilibacteria bacterium]|jgi:hypothetical protein
MKKLLYIILILIISGGGYYWFSQRNSRPITETINIEKETGLKTVQECIDVGEEQIKNIMKDPKIRYMSFDNDPNMYLTEKDNYKTPNCIVNYISDSEHSSANVVIGKNGMTIIYSKRSKKSYKNLYGDYTDIIDQLKTHIEVIPVENLLKEYSKKYPKYKLEIVGELGFSKEYEKYTYKIEIITPEADSSTRGIWLDAETGKLLHTN